MEDDRVDPLTEVAEVGEQEVEVPVAPAHNISTYKSPILKVDDVKYKHPTIVLPSEQYNVDDLNGSIESLKRSLLKDDKGKKRKVTDKEKEIVGNITTDSGILTALGYDGDEFDEVLNKDPERWTQVIDGDKGTKLYPSHIKYKSEDIADMDEDDRARYFSRVSGVGTSNNFYLWSSGLIITLDTFREKRILDLNIALSRNKVGLGNITRGASFSGDDVYIVTTILDFILSHVIDSNLKGWTMDKLRKLIRCKDIHLLMSGALATIYPGGYPVVHSCINRLKAFDSEEYCDYNIKAERDEKGDYRPDGLLDFNKVIWVDKNILSTNARIHMSAGSNMHTDSEIKRYQNDLLDQSPSDLITLWSSETTKISVKFKHSTLAEYTKSCKEWITNVTNIVDATMNIDSSGDVDERMEARNNMMISYSLTLNLLKQVNWVDHLVVEAGGIEQVINSEKEIKRMLEVFSEIEGFHEAFEKAVQTYKEDITVAMAGLPNFQCPTCNKGQVDKGAKYPTLIPMNMVGYFFIIMEWRSLVRFS